MRYKQYATETGSICTFNHSSDALRFRHWEGVMPNHALKADEKWLLDEKPRSVATRMPACVRISLD